MSSAEEPSKAAKILRRTRVGGGLTLCVVALLWLAAKPWGDTLVLIAGSVISAGVLLEAQRMGLFPPGARRVAAWCALACTVAMPWLVQVREWSPSYAAYRHALFPLTSLAACALWALVGSAGGGLDPRWKRVWPLLLVWIVLPMPWLFSVRVAWGAQGLVALALLSKIGDVAGYYFGNALGKHRPFPSISPGKTTEGCLASLLAGAATGALLAHQGLFGASPRFGLLSGLAIGASINLAAQAGDLFESWVKRRAQVKDSGTAFGPSGGLMDLVDSLLFSVPAALVTWPLLLVLP